ncbi:hypothetical protein [Chryseobacterium sp.]|uniref:hypothetical protein n=1 Tax=Chryseobacterium sp. TaxID=1871047 RepID=UPI0033407A24
MKKLIIHLVPAFISFIWLVTECHTFNPVMLKGPEFLIFYSILLFGFYASVCLLKLLKESISKITFYGMSLIFALGMIKLIRGIILGKPIGFLVTMLFLECIVGMLLIKFHFKYKIK